MLLTAPRARAVAVAGLLGLAAGSARAAAPTTIDMMEHIFGASNTNAVAGHGGLTAGVSADGDLTVLSWPSPSYYDQLCYLASNDLDVREQPHFGALDAMGSYLGLWITAGGPAELSWLRDASWSHSQGYSRDDAPVPVTTFERGDLGLTVSLTDIVSPTADVLTRRVQITRAVASPVTEVALVLYENLSPTVSKIAELPVADWALDSRNDFAALYDNASGQIIHFHPGDRQVIDSLLDVTADPTNVDFGPIEALMQSAAPSDAAVNATIGTLDDDYPAGVFAVVTSEPPPVAFQIGSDDSPLCAQVDELVDNITALPNIFGGLVVPIDPGVVGALRCQDSLGALRSSHGWQHLPESALSDVADGGLAGSRVAAGQTNGALITPALPFAGDSAEASVMFALGESLAAARQALLSETAVDVVARQQAAETAAADALAPAALPDPALGPDVSAVALRALVNLYVARDRHSGGFVASISRQPPYYLDWPRDGAFFTAALDVAGLLPWASQRASWYAGLQRVELTLGNPLLAPELPIDPQSGEPGFPAGAWEMNYFADGMVGGPIRFEIDNTALHVWALMLHLAQLDEPERGALLDQIWPSTRSALDLLLRWREADTGLPAPASEDDSFTLSSGLHGAAAVHAALLAGARMAKLAGEDERGGRYRQAAESMRAAILVHYYDAGAGLFRATRDGEPAPGSGAVAWMVWPSRVLAAGDDRLETQLVADMAEVLPRLQGQRDGTVYSAKAIVSAALYGADPGARSTARQALGLLAAAATSDTHHFGEVTATTSTDPLTWSNRVAQPHVWEGILFYLAAMALTDEHAFVADEAFALPSLPAEPAEGCACRLGGTGQDLRTPRWLALLLLGAAAGMRRGAGRRGARRAPGPD